jgi:hypothetical protein
MQNNATAQNPASERGRKTAVNFPLIISYYDICEGA